MTIYQIGDDVEPPPAITTPEVGDYKELGCAVDKADDITRVRDTIINGLETREAEYGRRTTVARRERARCMALK